MLDRIMTCLTAFRTDLLWGVVLAIASFVGSLVFVAIVVTRLPEDYFLPTRSQTPQRRSRLVRVVLLLLRNVAGWALILCGLVMSIPGVPGQGLLTIVIGLLLVDMPGKKRIERRVVASRRILRSINTLRKRFGKPPLCVAQTEVEREAIVPKD